jgi:hypothetical protein
MQEWYEAMQQTIVLLGSTMLGSIRRESSLNNGSISAGLTPGEGSVDPSPFASPIPSLPVSPAYEPGQQQNLSSSSPCLEGPAETDRAGD